MGNCIRDLDKQPVHNLIVIAQQNASKPFKT
jgi:hypothetical protein